jgi:hypothetical protein
MLVAGTATLYAFWVADVLVHEFSTGLTWVDVGTLFVMGLIAGISIGVLAGFGRAARTGSW